MLSDRDYMQNPSGGGRIWRLTYVLLALNVAAYLAQSAFLQNDFYLYFALSVPGLLHGFVWQLLTYQFMHGSWLHLFLNCWALFLFGPEVELILGKKRFLLLYLTSGIVGGLFQMFAAFVWPLYFGGAVVGASAGVFGVVAAYAMFYPQRELAMLLFFVIPVRMRAQSLLWFSLIVAAIGISWPGTYLAHLIGGNVAHAAHLGGILTGIAFSRIFVPR